MGEPSQRVLWHDTPEEALEADILAAGGMKAIGVMLWPEMHDQADEAGKKLRRILNREHNQKLAESERTLIVRAAAKKGSRCYASWIARQADGRLEIVAPEDRKAEIVERFDRLRVELKNLLKEIEGAP